MSEVVTGDAVVVEVRVAQPPIRAVALMIDMLVQVVLMVGVFLAVGYSSVISDPALAAAVSILISVLVIAGYPVIFETATRGRSLGKLALGLRVVSDDGGPERFRQALFRGLAGVLEFWTFFGAPALIASLISQRGKRLGDVFAGTIVISERGPSGMSQPVMMPPALEGWARTLELSQLPAEVAGAARQYLMRWHDLSPAVQHEMGVRIATQVAAYVTPPPPPGVPAHAYLSAVLAERRRRDQARYPQAGPGHGVRPQAGPHPPPAPYGRPYAQPHAPQAAPPQPSPQQPAPPASAPRTTPGGFAPPQ
ncbi:RDD family protein [Nonomuraea africana]|uniref:RDD family membrane protein YckC n=1 Tax=Nonomuraea africana TaxID=46171 RepID=A0ABR9KVT7_9ACTN|nr:RDD family protein [Nonomuraea africana]MBE1565753.1 putative RDD family membrane protein YckC [Nonomuraea africana]